MKCLRFEIDPWNSRLEDFQIQIPGLGEDRPVVSAPGIQHQQELEKDKTCLRPVRMLFELLLCNCVLFKKKPMRFIIIDRFFARKVNVCVFFQLFISN